MQARLRVHVKRWKKLPKVARLNIRVVRYKNPPMFGRFGYYMPTISNDDQAIKVWMMENLV